MIEGKPPQPPFQFIILKSILYQNCGGGFYSFIGLYYSKTRLRKRVIFRQQQYSYLT